MAKNRVSEYLGNLGKSVAFAAVDVLPEKMGASTSFLETNASLFKDIYAATKDYKRTFEKTSKIVIDSKIYKAADVAWKNTKESIVTGSFYSKEREEKYSLEAMGDMGDFSDMDINFDDLDMAISNNSKSSDDDSDIDKLGSKIEKSNYNSSEATCNMIANSTDYIVSNSRSNMKVVATQNARMMSIITNGFNSNNESINKVSSVISGPLMAHMDNSKKAYEKLTTGVDAIVGILTEINERQKSTYNKPQNNSSKAKIGIDDIMTADGVPDIKEYMKVIKGNAKKIMGPTGDMLFGDTMGEGSNLLLTFAANPLAFIPQYLIKSALPNSLDRSIKNFDKTVSGFFSTFIAKMNKAAKDDDSGVSGLIGKLLGVKNNFKSSLDVGSYKKGAIPFDGETKKSITEVIPTYLRNIERAVNQSDHERIFDYESGKWVKDTDVIKDVKNIRDQSINNAFSDIIPELKKYLERHASNEKYDHDQMEKSMKNMLGTIFNDYGSIELNNKKIYKDYMKYGVQSEEYFKILLSAMRSLPRESLTSMAGNVMSERTNRTRRMKQLEDNGNSILNNYFNNSISDISRKTFENSEKKKYNAPNNILYNAVDKKGNNVFFYLRTIANEIHELRINNSGNGGGQMLVRGRRNNFNSINVSNNNDNTNNTEWAKDLIPDNNKAKKDYEARKHSENEKYNRHIAALKKADGDKKLLAQYSNSMSVEEMNLVLGQMKDNEYKRLLNQTRRDFEADSPFQQYIQEQAEKNQKEKEKSGGKGLINRLIEARSLNDKLDVVKQSASDLVNIPSRSIEKILNVADDKLYQLMFGYENNHLVDKNGNPVNGFIGHLLYSLQNSFDKFNSFIDEQILKPLKDKLGIETMGDLFDKIATKLGFDKDRRDSIKASINEKLDPYKKAIKESFGDVFSETKNSLGDTFNYIKSKSDDDNEIPILNKSNLTVSQTGRLHRDIDRMKKSGLSSIEINRIMRKHGEVYGVNTSNINESGSKIGSLHNDVERMKSAGYSSNEISRIIRKHRDSYNKENKIEEPQEHYFGSKFVEKSGLTTISKGELIVPSELNPFNKDAGKTNKKDEIRKEKNIKNNFIQNLLNDGIKTRATGTGDMSDVVPGSLQAKLKEASSIAPKAVGRGSVGAVAALLTGVNPLLGLLLGGTIGVAEQSSSFQDWLFGQTNKEGKRTGGFISKDLQDKFDKATLSDMKTLGLSGMVAGLITPFGPVGGLLIGSSLGFAKNNKSISNYLFGELNEETGERSNDGVLSPETQKFIKNAAPNIAIGTVTSLLAGPFGFLGNMILGSGLGLVSSTEEFKSYVFGDEDDNGKRHGGALDKIKNGFLDFLDKYVYDPLKRFAKPVGQMIKNAISDIANGVKDGINGMLENTLGAPFSLWFKEHVLSPGEKVFGGAFKGITKVSKFAVTAPFSILGATGDMIRRGQINKGTANDLSADERLAFMKDHGGLFNKEGNYYLKKTDEFISKQSDEDVSKIANLLGQTVEGDRHFSGKIRERKKKLFAEVDNFIKENNLTVSRRQRDMLIKLAESGKIRDMNQVARVIGKQGKKGMKVDQQRGLYDLLSAGATDISEINTSRSAIKDNKKDVFKQFNDLGIDFINPKNARKYYEMYNKESKFRGSTSDRNKGKEPIDYINENTKKMIQLLEDLVDTNTYLASGGRNPGEIKNPRVRAKLMKKKNKDNDQKLTNDREMDKGINSNIKRSNKNLEKLKSNDIKRLEQAGYSKKDITRIMRKNEDKYKLSESESTDQLIGSDGHLTKKEHFMNKVEEKAAKKNSNKVTMYNPIDNKFHTFIRDSKSNRMVPDNAGAAESNGIYGKANNLLEVINNIGSGITGFLGIKSKKKTQKEIEEEEYTNPVNRFFTKILGGAGKIKSLAALGFIGANAVALTGHGMQAFKDHVWPIMDQKLNTFKDFLDEKFEGLGSKTLRVVHFLTGTEEYAEGDKGLPNLIKNSLHLGIDWLAGTGQFTGEGLPGFVVNSYIPWLKDGFNSFQDILGPVVEKAISGIITGTATLIPYVVRGLAAAIKQIFTVDFWGHVKDSMSGKSSKGFKSFQIDKENEKNDYYFKKTGKGIFGDITNYVGSYYTLDGDQQYIDNNQVQGAGSNGGISFAPPMINNPFKNNVYNPPYQSNTDEYSSDVVAKPAKTPNTNSEYSSDVVAKPTNNNKTTNNTYSNGTEYGNYSFPTDEYNSLVSSNNGFYDTYTDYDSYQMNDTNYNNMYGYTTNPSYDDINSMNYDNITTNTTNKNYNRYSEVIDENGNEILVDRYGNTVAVKNSKGDYVFNEDLNYENNDNYKTGTLGGSILSASIRKQFQSHNPLAKILDPNRPTKGAGLLKWPVRGIKFISRGVDKITEPAANIVKTSLAKRFPQLHDAAKVMEENAAKDEAKGPLRTALKSIKDKMVSKFVKKTAENATEETTEKVAKKTLKQSSKDLLNKNLPKFISWAKTGLQKLIKDPVIYKKLVDSVMFVKMLSKEEAEKVVKKLSESLVSRIMREVSGNFAKNFVKISTKFTTLLTTAGTVNLVFAVADFVSGMKNCETILGLTVDQDVTLGMRIVTGLLKAVNGFILLGIIPEELLIDIFVEVLAPALKLDMTELKKKREEAQRIIDKANIEDPNNAYDSVGDYNNKDSLWTKTKNAFKSLFGRGRATIVDRVASIRSTGSKIINNVKDFAVSKINSIKDFGAKLVGGYSTQKNNKYSNMKYGNSTIAEEGCGPVAAANLLNDIDVGQAAKYASDNGFVDPNGGTDINYFNSLLSSKGIPNSQTDNPNDVRNILKKGGQAVLLGKDQSDGYDKAYSSRMHFITAKGMDKKGNIIIDDPDLGTRTMKPNKVFRGMKASVLVGAGSHRKNKGFGRYSGFGFQLPENTDEIVKVAIQIISNNEGSYDTINKNDNGACSIGFLQWHAGRAKSIFVNSVDRINRNNNIHSFGNSVMNSNSIENNIEYLRNISWASFKLTNSTYYNLVKSVLSTKESKDVQNETAIADVQGYMNVAKKKGVTDPRALIYFADLYNQGPKYALQILNTANGKAGGYSRITLDIIHRCALSHSVMGRYSSRRNNVYDVLKNNTQYATNSDSEIIIDSDETKIPDRKPGLLAEISKLGNAALNKVWGKDVVEAVFGEMESSTDEYSNQTSYDNNLPSQSKPVENMRSKKGKLKYSLDWDKQNPDNGWGSCASTVGWAYAKSFPDVFKDKRMSANAADQYVDPRFTTVYKSPNANSKTLNLNNPSEIDRSILKPGDLLYYRTTTALGNNRINGVGHVDMYAGDNKYLNHGGPNEGDSGVNESTLSDTKLQRLVAVRRFNAGTSGSSRSDTDTSSSLKASKYISNNSISNSKSYIKKSSSTKNVSLAGGYSSTTAKVIRDTGSTYMSSDLYVKMMSAIIEILCRIADNTDKLSEISKALSEKMNINISTETLSAMGRSKSSNKPIPSSIKQSVRNSINGAISNNVPASNDIGSFNNKDTEYIVKAMRAIVSQ